MEGVMMRDRERLAIAVRKPGGDILLDVRPWFTLAAAKWLRRPLVRGFPILLETLVNGIKALNFSAKVAVEEDEEAGEIGPWAMGLTLAASIGFALLLFVVTPHLFSLGMKALGLSGGVEALSFHVWDGLFKMVLFVGYIAAISFLPDIRRVFQYHGAEHKVIWAFEQGAELSPAGARSFSRLHPRCGTAFLLFVLAISIVLYCLSRALAADLLRAPDGLDQADLHRGPEARAHGAGELPGLRGHQAGGPVPHEYRLPDAVRARAFHADAHHQGTR